MTLLRVAIIVGVLAVWEAWRNPGWLYRDVVPSLLSIGKRVSPRCLPIRNYYCNLGVTAGEIGIALAIGGIAGLAVGLVLGANRSCRRAYRALSLLSRADARRSSSSRS